MYEWLGLLLYLIGFGFIFQHFTGIYEMQMDLTDKLIIRIQAYEDIEVQEVVTAIEEE